MDLERLKKYALTICKVGANVQKGQEVWIRSDCKNEQFVALLVEECYKLGASYVDVEFTSEELTIAQSLYGSLEELEKLRSYHEERWINFSKVFPARIVLLSEAPDSLTRADSKKLVAANRKKTAIIKKYRDIAEDKHQWTIAGVPSYEWAVKVFPNLDKEEAYEKLFELILDVSRIDEDPILAWKNHNDKLLEISNKLTSYKFDYLHIKSLKSGTDIKIGLLKNTRFIAGGETNINNNVFYNPNIPTEECFTSPDSRRASGIVYSSKPLSYNGKLIEDFNITFKDGVVTSYHARVNEELLGEIINFDATSNRLGEVALVPFDSPISNSKTLFFNTLYDENAACHLALGTGFLNTYIGFENMTKEELSKVGINSSTMHCDFMIGDEETEITGYTSESKGVPIFKKGNWVI